MLNASTILEKYASSYLIFSKPLVALINGPVVRISVTVLGMLIVVLASSNASFQTPFPSLGQSPEECSYISAHKALTGAYLDIIYDSTEKTTTLFRKSSELAETTSTTATTNHWSYLETSYYSFNKMIIFLRFSVETVARHSWNTVGSSRWPINWY